MLRLILFLLVFSPFGFANAGITAKYDSTGAAMGGASSGSILIDKGKSRMDVDKEATVIFDGNAQRMEIINHKDRSFTVLDQSSAEAIATEIEPAIQQMRAQMQALPPEQRAMMEKMLAEKMGINLESKPADEPDLDLKKTGQSGEAGGFACDWWEARDATDLVYEYCVTPAKDLPSGEELLQYFQDLKQFKREIVGTINRSGAFKIPSLPIADVRDIEGLPLISRQYHQGEIVVETRFVAIQKTELPADTFAVPDGYKEQKLAGAGSQK